MAYPWLHSARLMPTSRSTPVLSTLPAGMTCWAKTERGPYQSGAGGHVAAAEPFQVIWGGRLLHGLKKFFSKSFFAFARSLVLKSM